MNVHHGVMCVVNGLFVNHRGHREHGGNIFYTDLLQISVSSVSSVVLIGLARGSNRALDEGSRKFECLECLRMVARAALYAELQKALGIPECFWGRS